MEEQDSSPLGKMKSLDKMLDEYESKVGLSSFAEQFSDESAKTFLSMTREQMEKMDIEGCAEAALLLGTFSFHIQRCYNREIARVNWAENTLKNMIAGKEQQYKGSWDSQFHQAVSGDGYAKGVLKIKNYAQQRADRITFLANSVRNVSDLFVNLQRAKIGMKNG